MTKRKERDEITYTSTLSDTCSIVLDDESFQLPMNENLSIGIKNLTQLASKYGKKVLIIAFLVKGDNTEMLGKLLYDLGATVRLNDDVKSHEENINMFLSIETLFSTKTFIIVSDNIKFSHMISKLCMNGSKVILVNTIHCDSQFINNPLVHDAFDVSDFFKNKKRRIEDVHTSSTSNTSETKSIRKEYCMRFNESTGCNVKQCRYVHKCFRCYAVSDINSRYCKCVIGVNLCHKSYLCLDGLKCRRSHTKREIEAFKSNGGGGYINTFTVQCYHSLCGNKDCQFYHDRTDAFCYLCGKNNAGHYIYECPSLDNE